MFKSMLIGLFVVILISWGIGAYNRLVKLRAAITLTYTLWQNSVAIQAIDALATSEAGVSQSSKASLESLLLKETYLAAVSQYNQAVSQIPAAWIAALFGFRSEYREESKY